MNPLKAPLNEAEIRQAVSVVKRDAGMDDSAWFETISLDESDRFPDKRCVYVCCYEPSGNRTLSGLVLLDSDELHDWRHIEGVQA
jgi:Cu2+-containing amine oxidase